MVFRSLYLKDKETANSTYMVQFTTISRSQICPVEFLKFIGMLSSLESNLLQCIFFSFKMAAFKITIIAVGVACFKHILENYHFI